jgi:hypothetical protein
VAQSRPFELAHSRLKPGFNSPWKHQIISIYL